MIGGSNAGGGGGIKVLVDGEKAKVKEIKLSIQYNVLNTSYGGGNVLDENCSDMLDKKEYFRQKSWVNYPHSALYYLYRINEDKTQTILFNQTSTFIPNALCSFKNNLYFSDNNGTYRYDVSSNKLNKISSLGGKAMGILKNVLYFFNNSSGKIYKLENSEIVDSGKVLISALRNGKLYILNKHPSSNGILLINPSNSVYKFDGENFTRITTDLGSPSSDRNSLAIAEKYSIIYGLRENSTSNASLVYFSNSQNKWIEKSIVNANYGNYGLLFNNPFAQIGETQSTVRMVGI